MYSLFIIHNNSAIHFMMAGLVQRILLIHQSQLQLMIFCFRYGSKNLARK